MNELRSAIEAVLFVAEKPVTVGELVRATGARPREVEQALAALEELRGSSGLRLQRDGDAWRLVTSPESARAVTAYLGADRLRISHAALETLSVIAYRQPATRADVESIRGVNCDQTVETLMARRLIEEVGRAERPGRPILYGTTWEFLECFGLSSIDELPRVLTPEGERLDESAPREFAEPIE
ncbi:MAG: SMC-Scp complex subunit ScpB [Chloroflexi bacterium]|nr:MAG: SMC-Scp complex subunit ScpB [Chloroflexota bacterium]